MHRGDLQSSQPRGHTLPSLRPWQSPTWLLSLSHSRCWAFPSCGGTGDPAMHSPALQPPPELQPAQPTACATDGLHSCGELGSSCCLTLVSKES